jgi:hypothetical protein
MTRGREILIIVSVFALPGIVLFPAIHLSTAFTATVRTKSIQFTTAAWKTSAGLFNSDETPLDLTIEDFDRIESRQPSASSPFRDSEPVTLHGVRLHSVDVTRPLLVSIEADDGALSMKIERLGPEGNELASFVADRESQLPPGMTGTAREWSVFGKHNRLHLILRPGKGQLRAESKIPLSDGSAITFDLNGQSAIVPSEEAQLTALDRKLQLDGQSLMFGGIKSTTIESLGPDAQSVKLVIAEGSSSQILLGQRNEAATLAEFLTSQKPLATYLSTVALIGSTILTILTRLKFIKSKD